MGFYMSDFLQIVSTLREQMSATLSRSDVLKPLAWLVALLLGALSVLVYLKAPDWMLIGASAFLAIGLCLYFLAYIFCLVRDRDALRSEKYSLNKMAIEHGIYGDSRTGIEVPPSASAKVITAAAEPVRKIEDQR